MPRRFRKQLLLKLTFSFFPEQVLDRVHIKAVTGSKLQDFLLLFVEDAEEDILCAHVGQLNGLPEQHGLPLAQCDISSICIFNIVFVHIITNLLLAFVVAHIFYYKNQIL